MVDAHTRTYTQAPRRDAKRLSRYYDVTYMDHIARIRFRLASFHSGFGNNSFIFLSKRGERCIAARIHSRVQPRRAVLARLGDSVRDNRECLPNWLLFRASRHPIHAIEFKTSLSPRTANESKCAGGNRVPHWNT